MGANFFRGSACVAASHHIIKVVADNSSSNWYHGGTSRTWALRGVRSYRLHD